MPDDKNIQQQFPELHAGMGMMSADGQEAGKVLEVMRDVGSVEAFGQAGIPPQQHDFDATKYGYSDAMPGAGDNFFVARGSDGKLLYVPFSAIQQVNGDHVMVAADAASIPDLGWNVRPDALSSMPDEYPVDEGGESMVA
jgi:hypothetical protein